jgi:methylenetetrahydrofolate reductase (NADPH)
MEYQSPLHKKLHDGVFVFTAETTPPDASNKETLLKTIEPLKDVADAINITDSPGAKVHMSALTAAIILAQNDIDPILQLTVRDRNRLALQGDLVGASALGVHNILCLSGDDPKVGDQPETNPAKDIDSVTLVATANMMRKDKKFPSGRKPDTEKILGKIKNGIDFFQTQYVFEAKKLEEYMKVLNDAGILEKTSFLIGLGPFASAKSAKWMNDNLFGVDVPDEIIKRLEQAKDQKEESKKICLELIKIFREIKGVKGIHLMGHKKEEVIAEIIKESKIS